MTDDSSRDLPSNDADANDPAAAFEALRRTIETQGMAIGAEMTIIRRGLETAFDQLDKIGQPTDYGADLGRIVQQLAEVSERLATVEQTPVLRQGAEHFARTIERSGHDLVRAAVQKLETESRDLQRVARSLAEHVDGARERGVQNRRLWGMGIAGVVSGAVLGVVMTLFLPRLLLPGLLDVEVAARVMNADAWNAGGALMRSASPLVWRNLVEGGNLLRGNQAEVAACRDAAARTKKDQRCTITVPALVQ